MRFSRLLVGLSLGLLASQALVSAEGGVHKASVSVSVTGASAEALYGQHQYAASADAFEQLIKTSSPVARLYYYAALANIGCNRTARAKQLFDYVGKNFSDSQEGISSKKYLSNLSGERSNTTLAAATTGKGSGTAKSDDEELPESVVNAMAPEMRALLKTDAGKIMVKNMLAEKKEQVQAIKAAEGKGIIDKKNPLPPAKAQAVPPTKPRGLGDNHPFTAADIARDGAGGIDQSRYPNCWFESSMSALARLPRGQKMLADMIQLAPKGGYVVRFPGDGNEYAITKQYLEENSIHDKASWASIIECAQVCKFPDNSGANGQDGDQSRLEIGLKAITGNRAELIDLRTATPQEVSAFIGGATKSDNPIVAATWQDAYLVRFPRVVIGSHAYTIIGFDPGSQLITIRNPHGKNSQKFSLPSDPNHLEFEQMEDGVFKMHLGLFQKCFYQAARSFI
ncbi:MAG: hypothetical protein P4L53_12475 [Candidatus Obscuribacterales bacterium]|nr:hypothetical protein [Candidatus Obscuribacterales bacterium]